jgi:cellobiose phosphorylase
MRPLLFSVPAFGSFLLCSQDVGESRSPKADKTARAAVRRAGRDSSTSAHDGKKPLTRLATLATLSPKERAVDAFVLGVRESGEQTQNVYENKEQGQEVKESRS